MDDLLHLGGGPYRWGRDSNDPVLSGLPMVNHSLGSMDPMCLGAQGWSWSRGHGELASVFEPASETFKGRYRCEVVGRSDGTTGHQDPAYLCGADGADFGGIGGRRPGHCGTAIPGRRVRRFRTRRTSGFLCGRPDGSEGRDRSSAPLRVSDHFQFRLTSAGRRLLEFADPGRDFLGSGVGRADIFFRLLGGAPTGCRSRRTASWRWQGPSARRAFDLHVPGGFHRPSWHGFPDHHLFRGSLNRIPTRGLSGIPRSATLQKPSAQGADRCSALGHFP